MTEIDFEKLMEAKNLPESDREELRKFREFLRDRKRYLEQLAVDPEGKIWAAVAEKLC